MDDTFSDGSRTNQALPGSAHWYAGGESRTVGVTSQGLTFQNSNDGVMAYFSATTLNVGDSLTLSFDYSFTKTVQNDNSFMFGLYNSAGSQMSQDGGNFNANTFKNYTGYATSGILGKDTSKTGFDHIETRNIKNNNLINMSTYTEGDTDVQSGAATPGQIYEASMQISRTAAGIVVQSQIGDTVMVQTYTNAMFTTFDTVGVFAPNGDAGTFTLDNVQLDYVGAPEPSTFFAMMLLGMAVFGKVFGRTVRGMLLTFLPRLAVP